MSKVKNKTSEAQLRASKKWDDANKEKKDESLEEVQQKIIF